MTLYSRHIFLSLLKVFGLIVLTLTTIIILIQVLAFINHYFQVNLGFFSIIKFIFLQSPSIFYYVFPISLICTILYVYYSLIVDKELVILESSGVSKWQISLPAIKFSLMIMLVSYIITMFIEPIATRSFRNHKKSLIQSSMLPSILEEKSFSRISSNIILYVENQDADNKFRGIVIYDEREKGHEVTIFARKAKILNKDDKFIFILQDGSRQEIVNNNLRTLYFNVLSLPVELNKIVQSSSNLNDNSEYTIFELLSKKANTTHEVITKIVEINNRFSYSLLNVVVALISLVTLSSMPYSRDFRIVKIKQGIASMLLIISSVLFIRINVSRSFIFIPILYLWISFVIYASVNLLKSYSECDRSFFTIIKSLIKKKKKSILSALHTKN